MLLAAILPVTAELLLSSVVLAGLFVLIGFWLGRRGRRLQTYATEAYTDALTGLSNRRAFDERLEVLFRSYRQSGRGFVLALVDIDHFKVINDSQGHLVGDGVLRRIAAILSSECRDANMVARYGGDEFAILIVAPIAVAADKLDRMRRQIADQPIEVGDRAIKVTISVGLGEPRGESSVALVVGRADETLYEAKKLGRNRICFDAALTESASIGHTDTINDPKFQQDTQLVMTPPSPAPILTCTLDELETDLELQERIQHGAVSIGNFDGVHAGHRELLGHVRAAADRVGGPAVVVVLDPHPATVLRPHSAPARLTTIARRAELMGELGIDVLVVCPATLEFLDHTADEFFELLITNRLRAHCIVEGPNFFFGRDRGGDINRLRQLCQRSGKSVEIVEPRLEEQRMVSSSRIREAIAAGQIRTANAMLQSTYQVSGRVARGAGRGHSLGFPTANLVDLATLVPGHGVYAAHVSGERLCDNKAFSSPRLAAVHVGPNPTFDDEQRTKVEVHCLDYDGDLYDQIITIHWFDQIRGIKKFDNADALAVQIHRDVAAVRSLASETNFR